MITVGVIAEDNKRVRYLVHKLQQLSLRVHLIDVDKAARIKNDLHALIIVRHYVCHAIIEKAQVTAKNAKVFYLDRSSITQIDLFCSTFRLGEKQRVVSESKEGADYERSHV